MDLDKTIKERRSVRKFKSAKPDWRDIIECIDAMRYAPMAGNNFSIKVILVDEEDKIQELAETAQQPFIAQANYVLVVCTTPSRTEISYGERGKIYLKQQAGAAIQNFLLKITEKKLSSCWIGHFAETQVKRTLSIPEDVHVEALLPVGYAFKKPEQKRKIELDAFLYFNTYGRNKMNVVRKLDT
jgi:nitroreductase